MNEININKTYKESDCETCWKRKFCKEYDCEVDNCPFWESEMEEDERMDY